MSTLWSSISSKLVERPDAVVAEIVDQFDLPRVAHGPLTLSHRTQRVLHPPIDALGVDERMLKQLLGDHIGGRFLLP